MHDTQQSNASRAATPARKTLTLSGKFYTPEWHIFDTKSEQFLGRCGRLVRSLNLAASYDDEETAGVEVTYIVQHPEQWPLLPSALGLKIVSHLEAKSAELPAPRKLSFRRERNDVGGGYGRSDY